MLKCETNTAKVEKEVMAAAAKRLNQVHHHLSAAFDHGQWWMSCLDCGASWSVVDCQRDGVDYLDFEAIDDGDESFLQPEMGGKR